MAKTGNSKRGLKRGPVSGGNHKAKTTSGPDPSNQIDWGEFDIGIHEDGTGFLVFRGVNIVATTWGEYTLDTSLYYESQSLPKGNWVEFTVLNRARKGYEHQKFDPSDPRSLARHLSPEKGVFTPKWAIVGWSIFMGGPAVAMVAPSPNQAQVEFEDDTKKCEIGDLMNNTSLSRLFIPHFSMLFPGNMIAVKKHVSGITIKHAFGKDQQTSERIMKERSEIAARLFYGAPIRPMMKKAEEANGVNGKVNTLDDWLTPRIKQEDLHSTDNQYGATISYSPQLLRRGNAKRLTGYQLQLPLVLLNNYPKGLVTEVVNFLAKSPKELISLNVALAACHVWADIYNHPDKQIEWCVSQKGNPTKVPDVSLAKFIIYFPHLLRWTEYQGLAEYPHACRFVECMYGADVSCHARFRIDDHDISERKVQKLLKQVESKVSEIPTTYRVSMLPSMMPGTTMPSLAHVDFIRQPESSEILLTGIGSVSNHGLPSYMKTQSPVAVVAVPATIAVEKTGNNTAQPLNLHHSRTLNILQVDGMMSLLFPQTQYSLVWRDPNHTNDQGQGQKSNLSGNPNCGNEERPRKRPRREKSQKGIENGDNSNPKDPKEKNRALEATSSEAHESLHERSEEPAVSLDQSPWLPSEFLGRISGQALKRAVISRLGELSRDSQYPFLNDVEWGVDDKLLPVILSVPQQNLEHSHRPNTSNLVTKNVIDDVKTLLLRRLYKSHVAVREVHAYLQSYDENGSTGDEWTVERIAKRIQLAKIAVISDWTALIGWKDNAKKCNPQGFKSLKDCMPQAICRLAGVYASPGSSSWTDDLDCANPSLYTSLNALMLTADDFTASNVMEGAVWKFYGIRFIRDLENILDNFVADDFNPYTFLDACLERLAN
ncbi:hypothetical protein PT974_05979 [Cladobotryum mycophilum]|uniref:Uncharacterized protein n=1 Tax=Cladobotryum mycophilum TaxID=491253 RepID=A0ABR0SL86_9HYPO